MKRGLILLVVAAAGAGIWLYRQLRPVPLPPTPRTVEQVLRAIGPRIDRELRSRFAGAGAAYPPSRVDLVAFKAEKRLDVFAPDASGSFVLVCSHPILAASGTAGPKLREGDLQVPEGVYRIELLNPNSRFHLSLRVNYPNADDLVRAREEGRDPATLGGDIMIHGNAVSIGCLAMGDSIAEELFVLAARTGLDRVRLLIAPNDLRAGPATNSAPSERLRRELGAYPPPPGPTTAR